MKNVLKFVGALLCAGLTATGTLVWASIAEENFDEAVNTLTSKITND